MKQPKREAKAAFAHDEKLREGLGKEFQVEAEVSDPKDLSITRKLGPTCQTDFAAAALDRFPYGIVYSIREKNYRYRRSHALGPQTGLLGKASSEGKW